MSDIGFTVTKNGNWPEETYKFSPITSIFPNNLGYIKYLGLSFYSKTPYFALDEYDSFTWPYKAVFKPANQFTPAELADGYPLVDYQASDSSLFFVASAVRRQKSYSNLVNYFILQDTSTNPAMFYGYLFYPQNLILKPTQASRINSTQYTLQLKASLSDQNTIFFKFENPMNVEATPLLHKNYMLSGNSNITDYPTSNNNLCTFFYGISSNQSISRKKIINYTKDNNPATYGVLLNTTQYQSKLRKDRTFVEFNLDFRTTDKEQIQIETLANPHPDSFVSNKPLSMPINYLYEDSTGIQTFLLLQSGLNLAYPIQDIRNSVSYIKLNTNTTKLDYTVLTRNLGSTFYKLASGQAGTSLSLSYFLDSSYIHDTGESVQNTVLGYNVQGTPSATLNNGGIKSNVANNNTITFTTKYPPHYYSYQLAVSSTSMSNEAVENATTYFQLSSYTFDNTNPNFILIHTVLQTENKMMMLELETFGEHDEIMYVPDFTEQSLLNDIPSAFVGTKTSTTTPYDLKNPTWVSAQTNSVLKVNYPDFLMGSAELKIRPKLKTKNGLNEAQIVSIFELKGKYDTQTYPLYYETIKEDIDYIDIDISMLNSTIGYPGVDLTNSNISWTYNTSDPNVKLYTLTKNVNGTYTRTNSIIPKNTALPYDLNSWYVRLEGYGPNTTTLTLSSQKHNNTVQITTDPTFFDYFYEKKLIVEPVVSFDNSPEIRTVTLSAYIPFKGRKYNLKSDSPIFWSWTYNNTYNSLSTPITANYTKYSTNQYTSRENDFADINDKLKFSIKPLQTNVSNDVNVKITAHTADTIIPYTGTYEIDIDTFPNTNLLNANFFIAYQSFPNDKILETSKKQYVLTRPNNTNAKYTLKTDLPSDLSYTSLRWEIVNAANQKTTFNNLQSINLDATTSSKFTVTLYVVDAQINGWNKKHTAIQTVTIYSLPQADFDKSLNFLIYPEYTWKYNDKLTLLNNSNYTLSVGPTAYRYKNSNDQNFKVLADSGFDKYVYNLNGNGVNLGTFDSRYGMLTIPYTNAYLSTQGQTIYLSAYNEYYPEGTSLYYKTIESNVLVTKTFNNVTKTIPYSTSTSLANIFYQNPKGIEYNSFKLNFNPLQFTYNLDDDRSIKINQSFENLPLDTPAKILETTSTVTYILSAPKWIVKKDIPAVNGTFTLFNLNVGDDLTELTINGTRQNTLKLTASANLNIQIPSSTFDNYDLVEWPTARNLWGIKNININTNYNSLWNTLLAYTLSVQPKIFLSTYYATTGSDVFVEFETPDYPTNKISSYEVDFGDGNIYTGSIDNKFYHTYQNSGTYYVKYKAIFEDTSVKEYIENKPFIIIKQWSEYSQEKIRIIDEAELEMPYNEDDVKIQPNEFGDVDIFNTCLKRILDCLQFLKNNTQTINIDSPIVYYGWMGTSNANRSAGIRWYTETTYGNEFYAQPEYAIPRGLGLIIEGEDGPQYGYNQYYPSDKFDNIKDIYVGEKYIYVLDDKKFRLFDNGKESKEIKFLNASEQDELFFDPRSIVVSDDESSIYVADSIRHKIYRLDFDFSDPYNPLFSLVLTVGTLGSLNDSSKFDFPTDLNIFDENLFVLDYNNNCVKQYSKDLSWIYTYYDNRFEGKQIINITVHPNGLLYVLTNESRVYIFDQLSEEAFATFDISNATPDDIVKIIFDENGEFLLVVSKTNVLKYSSVGEYITHYSLPELGGLEFTSAISSKNRTINISSKYSILRFQDFVQIFKIGGESGKSYWSNDQILLKKNEFAQDLNYNVALNRLAQNIKNFRDSLNAKFVLVSEQTSRGRVTYFTIVPISKNEIVSLDVDVESENLMIGVNEFYIPSVINREIVKLFKSVTQLKTYLDVSTVTTDKGGDLADSCLGEFCWSWKAMSCYDLSLPAIRVCNINPITYSELVKTFPVNYSPTKSWIEATSNCCNENASPLD
jgi:hypothetical protein